MIFPKNSRCRSSCGLPFGCAMPGRTSIKGMVRMDFIMRLRRLKRAADRDQSRWISAHLGPHLGSIQRAWQTGRSGSLDHLGERLYRGIDGHGWIGPISTSRASVFVQWRVGVHERVSQGDSRDRSLSHTTASETLFLIAAPASYRARSRPLPDTLASNGMGLRRVRLPQRCRE